MNENSASVTLEDDLESLRLGIAHFAGFFAFMAAIQPRLRGRRPPTACLRHRAPGLFDA